MRWPRCVGPARPWPTSSASTRARAAGARGRGARPVADPRRPGPARAGWTRRVGEPRRPRAGRPADLVDRAREMAALRRMVDELADGSAGCVLVEGPAGIGKTRLLVEAIRLATAGGRPGAVGAGKPAGAVLRLRGGAPALRALPAATPTPARRCSAERPGRDARVRRRVGDDAGAAGQLRRAARALLADRQPRRRTGRWCSSSTTCSGATARRCATSPTWSSGSRGCRCSSCSRCGPASPTPTTRCSPRSRSTRRSPCSGRPAVGGGGAARWSASGSARARTPSSTPATG